MASLRMASLRYSLIPFLALLARSSAYHLCATTGPCDVDPQVLPLPTNRMDFQIYAMHVQTPRQFGAHVNIKAKWRYYENATMDGTFDYVPLKVMLMGYLEPSDDLPEGAYWEEVGRQMAVACWENYPIRGVSVRLEVKGMSSASDANPNGIQGHRVAINTLGDIEPLNENIEWKGCSGMDKEGVCDLGLWGSPNSLPNSVDAEVMALLREIRNSKDDHDDIFAAVIGIGVATLLLALAGAGLAFATLSKVKAAGGGNTV